MKQSVSATRTKITARPIRAVVFGKYPREFVAQRIVPQLESLGIEVVSFDTNPGKFKKANLDGIDVVFFLSELAAHKECDQIKQSIRRHDTRLVYLSRKTSMWPMQFQRAGLMQLAQAMEKSNAFNT